MEGLIREMAQALVDSPQEVSISQVDSKSYTILELSVAKEDTGKIIGKKGRIINALRTILSAVAAKERKHVILEVNDKKASDQPTVVNLSASRSRSKSRFAF
jgi:predicted RNA-binding protein YlqC (UPF0109 family)